MTAQARWHLTYSAETVAEPIVWSLGIEHSLVTNIRRADVRDHVGWVILDVRGEPEQMEEARRWLERRGLRVSVLTEDVIPD
ncbi:MAG: NIL domain-containing protein [Actinomycetota bacterium]